MKPVSIRVARTQLSKLIGRAEAGAEVVITRAGKPAARLVALSRAQGMRRLGLFDGTFRIPDNFNAPLPESVARVFKGRKE